MSHIVGHKGLERKVAYKVMIKILKEHGVPDEEIKKIVKEFGKDLDKRMKKRGLK